MILPKSLVIVEDEVITQRFLQDIVSQYDVEVTGCFDNAQDTLENIKKIKCDMMLMDINIKGSMDGIQLAREILRDNTIPIIFITAHNDDDTLEELLELAPYGFIGKPFSSKDVLVTLQIAYKRYTTHSKTSTSTVAQVDKPEVSEVRINDKYYFSKEKDELYANEIALKLNPKQRMLIRILVSSINQSVPNGLLVSQIWENEDVADSALRTLVYSLRKLLPDLPLISQSKVGYQLISEKNERV